MKLPNVAVALVPADKITGYLLSPTHRDGRHKAAFFFGSGFALDAWQALAAALLAEARGRPRGEQSGKHPFWNPVRGRRHNRDTAWTNTEHSFGVVSGNQSGSTALCHSLSTQRSRR